MQMDATSMIKGCNVSNFLVGRYNRESKKKFMGLINTTKYLFNTNISTKYKTEKMLREEIELIDEIHH